MEGIQSALNGPDSVEHAVVAVHVGSWQLVAAQLGRRIRAARSGRVIRVHGEAVTGGHDRMAAVGAGHRGGRRSAAGLIVQLVLEQEDEVARAQFWRRAERVEAQNAHLAAAVAGEAHVTGRFAPEQRTRDVHHREAVFALVHGMASLAAADAAVVKGVGAGRGRHQDHGAHEKLGCWT